MDTLKAMMERVIAGYAGEGLNGISYLTRREGGNVLTVTDFARIAGRHIVGVSVVVRLIGDKVIIERDQNDKLVLDALIEAGIPRDHIIAAYAGEAVPLSA